MGKSRYWVIGWFSGEQRDRPVIGKTESMRSSTDHTTARLNQRSGNACAICLGVPATGENFVDRAEQLEIMLSVTAAVIVGQAQNSVAFIGAAGMGKTSLLLEGARRIQAEYGKKTIPIAIFGRGSRKRDARFRNGSGRALSASKALCPISMDFISCTHYFYYIPC